MAETTGLLNRRTSQAYHEFESRPLREMQSRRTAPHESAAFVVCAQGLRKVCFPGPLDTNTFRPLAGPFFLDCSRTDRVAGGPPARRNLGTLAFLQKPLLNALRGGFLVFGVQKKCTKNAPNDQSGSMRLVRKEVSLCFFWHIRQ